MNSIRYRHHFFWLQNSILSTESTCNSSDLWTDNAHLPYNFTCPVYWHAFSLFCDRYIIGFSLLFLRAESRFCSCYYTSLTTVQPAYNNTFIAVECKRLVGIWRWDCFSWTLPQKREQLHSSINMLPCNFLLLNVFAAVQEDFRAVEVPKSSLSN